jgi:hypothetical protein
MDYGDIRVGDTLDVFFTTVASTGAPTQLAGSPAVAAYVGNSTTEITAGLTLTVDFDSRTGLNHVRIVATSGNGFSAGSNVRLVLTAGTVGGTSVVGYVVAAFSIEARSALMPTTAGRLLDVSAGGEAGLDWANIGSPTTAVNLSGTNIDVDQVVASVSGAVATVTGAVGSVASGGITAASFGANAITAAKLDPDVTTELQAGLATAASLTTVEGKIDTLDTNVDTLLTRITSTLFTGITSLAEWLGLMAGKQTGNSTARTEIRATGAGSGTYSETTDSLEAVSRQQGSARWTQRACAQRSASPRRTWIPS